MAVKQRRQKEVNGSTVVVGDMPFEKALRLFKRKCNESGVVQEVRERMEYIKPSIERKLAKNAARKRLKKKLALEQLPKKQY